METFPSERLNTIPGDSRELNHDPTPKNRHPPHQQSAENGNAIVRQARCLVNRSVKVGVEDGRIFLGAFQCLDKQGNIILHDTVECRDAEQRALGMVLIPARCRTSCHVECESVEEKLELLPLA